MKVFSLCQRGNIGESFYAGDSIIKKENVYPPNWIFEKDGCKRIAMENGSENLWISLSTEIFLDSCENCVEEDKSILGILSQKLFVQSV